MTHSIVERAAQPYLAGLIGWAGARGITPVGAPFLKYDVIDMAGALQVSVGFPSTEVEGEGEVVGGCSRPGGTSRLSTLDLRRRWPERRGI